MTQQTPNFSVSEFELRGITSPYLTPAQAVEVATTETRVNEQLDFLAQMLGWNGPNYWTNLPSTVDQKRQLLGGTFGVYNSYVIPKIYEIRNWDNKLVIDRLPFLVPGRQTQVARILLGDNVYQLQSVEVEGDKYVISIGELTQEFFDLIAANEPLQADVPTYRPAPFRRSNIGVSGDATFTCGISGGSLALFPAYDTKKQFPVKFPILFDGAVYYFDQPIYLSLSSTLTPDITPLYDEGRQLWYLEIPDTLVNTVGLTAYLAWANSNAVQANNYYLEVSIQSWVDPSDWSSISVLNNFRGVWGNKGGDLPFNFVFDALSIHGFSERDSVYLPEVQTSLEFNEIVNYIYYQKTTISVSSPPGAQFGDLWWNDTTGALSVWLPGDSGCDGWVEIDYRQQPRQMAAPSVVYPDVIAFRAGSPSLPVGTIVLIEDVAGLDVVDNVIGVQGSLTGPASLTLHRDSSQPYWTPDRFTYSTVALFEVDAPLLPFKVPVAVVDSRGLAPQGSTYKVNNLGITIDSSASAGLYEVLLLKYYTNETWEIYPDSILKYIAYSALFGSPLAGEMWWDFINQDPNTRAAAIYSVAPSPLVQLGIQIAGQNLPDGVWTNLPLISETGVGGLGTVDLTVAGGIATSVTVNNPGDKYVQGEIVRVSINPITQPSLVPLQGCYFEVTEVVSQAWASVNSHPQSGPPAPTLNLGTVLFYCDGVLVQNGVTHIADDYLFTVTQDPANGQYDVSYQPRTFVGRAQLPTITISDSLTTTYRADVTELVFSGITYYMSPNVYNAETPLRLWKAQDLQVAETVDHLEEDNYINPLVADLNNGPGPENWEKYFVRLPLEYGRNESVWQKVALICQDFAYWGSSVEPEQMRCPPEDDAPAIYEELFLYGEEIPDFTYVYSEPYLYSNVAYFNSTETGPYRNSVIYPASDVQFDEFSEAEFIEYDPLHNRQADTTSPVTQGYGDWLGEYVNINPCVPLTGFFDTDLLNGGIEPIAAPVWDASIYKFAPTCENAKESYNVDANHYKIGYAYFVADASAAEDTFFDISQEAAWRYPVTQPKTLYLTPR